MTSALVAGIAVIASPHGLAWVAYLSRRVMANFSSAPSAPVKTSANGHAAHAHDDHDHDHPGHDDANALELSSQAEANIGLRTLETRLGDFQKTITLPAMVVERPGQSTMRVTAPFTGVVTRILPTRGEAVTPGQPLFELRLTHEEVVQAQSEFLRFLGERDVLLREIARLEPLEASGTIAGKVLLDRKYEQHKLDAAIEAQRQTLLLHGLSDEQVAEIVATRQLLRAFTIKAPAAPDDSQSAAPRYLQVESIDVEQGQHLTAGDSLCALADHAELYIEGTAFSQDAPLLERAIDDQAAVTAMFDSENRKPEVVVGLRILYLDSKVDPVTRGLHFYVRLPNRLARDFVADEHRYIGWQFKPGQRLNVRVPVDVWRDRIVLPVEAVVQEGAESYVFVRFGDHFDRRPIRVEYRDASSVVVPRDGGLTPGDRVAANGAHQLHLALKNKAGGGIDPHAGHNH